MRCWHISHVKYCELVGGSNGTWEDLAHGCDDIECVIFMLCIVLSQITKTMLTMTRFTVGRTYNCYKTTGQFQSNTLYAQVLATSNVG